MKKKEILLPGPERLPDPGLLPNERNITWQIRRKATADWLERRHRKAIADWSARQSQGSEDPKPVPAETLVGDLFEVDRELLRTIGSLAERTARDSAAGALFFPTEIAAKADDPNSFYHGLGRIWARGLVLDTPHDVWLITGLGDQTLPIIGDGPADLSPSLPKAE